MGVRCSVPAFFLVVLMTGLLASSAEAQDFSADFSTGDADFEVFEFDLEGGDGEVVTPDYSPTGGNPGGFIRFTDSDSGAGEWQGAFAVPTPAVAGQLGREVSLDLRHTGGTSHGFGPQVSVQSASGNLFCVFGEPPTSWTSYSAIISAADPCWTRTNGTDATAADFTAVFGDATANWIIWADYVSNAGEMTDLDNFVIGPQPFDREITLRYKKRSQAFGGALSHDSGPAADDCVDTVPVELYQVTAGEDKLLDTDLTDANGKFKIAKKARKNKKYYALAPETETPVCAAATSKTIKPL
jgi:hypothetical protein